MTINDFRVIEKTAGFYAGRESMKKELEPKKKEIELVRFIHFFEVDETSSEASRFLSIKKIGAYDNHDVIMCKGRSGIQQLYFGHWNDGGFYRDGEWVDCNE